MPRAFPGFPRASGSTPSWGIDQIHDLVMRSIPAQPWQSDYGPYQDWLNKPVTRKSKPSPPPDTNTASTGGNTRFGPPVPERLRRAGRPNTTGSAGGGGGAPAGRPATSQFVQAAPGLRTTPIVNRPGRAQTTAMNLAAQQAGMPAINWTKGNPEFDAAAAAGAAAAAARAGIPSLGYGRSSWEDAPSVRVADAFGPGAPQLPVPALGDGRGYAAGFDPANDVDTRAGFDAGAPSLAPALSVATRGGLPDTSNPATQAYWDRADIQAWANASPGNRKLAENLQRRVGFTPAQAAAPGNAASWQNMPTTRVAEAFGPGAPQLPVPTLSDGRGYAAGFNPANDVDTRVGFTTTQLEDLPGSASRRPVPSLGENQEYAAGFNPANDVDTRAGFTGTASLPAAADPSMRVAPAQSTADLTEEQRQAQWLNSNYLEALKKRGIGVGS